MGDIPETRYAKTVDGGHVAFQVMGAASGHPYAAYDVHAYWLAGGSEGWYVHVARNYKPSREQREPTHQDLMLGKFWTPQDAAFAAEIITRFMNGVFKDVDELISESRARMDS